ncbi:OmpH family outer membrane protein [Thalassotalea euphylliae]|uniref:OmpH family outer membrane protein n=1 Tax=Thalassotalea euphylliae TaxID=1655234 RepID=A0A3E0UHQ0_9GAMM|nr:OmpH family outer membrane protein [Thalassotalea euphylliae]REL32402.1 OmpH family outer membrane protein [Thalassotalea euphylliae]REL36124.1 OmpH family outer membrane protein [Thalassotalea euphylliae]
MKKLMKTLALTTAASSMLLAGSAMAQKIAVVNFQEVMTKIPQTAAVMQKLETEFKDEKAVLAQLEKDIKYFQEKKKRDSSLMTDKEKTDLDKEIATKFQEYQTKGKDFQQKTQVRQNEETSKIIALVRQAIDNIAAKEKYDMVIEQKAVVFSKPETSITEQVVEQVSKLN